MSVDLTSSNGQPAYALKHPSGASALVYVYAAHLASWIVDGEEQIFVSSLAEYGDGKAIRGGVPICWPQFAEKGPYKKHGFARNSDKWNVVRTATEPYPTVVLGLKDDESTRDTYPFAFSLMYSISLDSADSLSISITVRNPAAAGSDPLEFTTALHTYFRVDNLAVSRLVGLSGTSYVDNSLAGGGKEETQGDEPVAFEAEVDRVYAAAPAVAHLVDGKRAIKVLKMGFPDAVVWNIGEARASGLTDLGAGEWKGYVCYEAAAINQPVKLAPNASWTAGQTFTRMAATEVPSPECKA